MPGPTVGRPHNLPAAALWPRSLTTASPTALARANPHAAFYRFDLER